MCLQYLAFMTVSAALFGVISVFYAGLYRARYKRRRQKRPMIVIIRMLLAVFITTNSLAGFVIAFWLFKQRPYAVVTSELVTVLSWCCHAVSLWVFSTSLAYNDRGPLLLNSCWYLTFVASIFHFHSTIRWTQHPTQYQHTAPSEIYFTLLSRLTTYIHMGLQILYGLSFIFSVPESDSDSQHQSVMSGNRYSRQERKGTSIQHTIDTSSEDEEDMLVREKQPLLDSLQGNRSSYGGLATGSNRDIVSFNISMNNAYEDSASCLSLLLFWWVWPLLRRGAMGYLETVTDLPPLPRQLKTSYIRTKFRNVLLKKQQSRPDNNGSVSEQSEHNKMDKETPTAASKDHEAFMESEVMLRSVTRSTPIPHTPTPEPTTTTNSNSTGRQSTDSKKDVPSNENPLRLNTSILFLFSAMNSAFGWHYYPLGLLKLTTDLLGFAGPLLLYQLVSFIENKKVSLMHVHVHMHSPCNEFILDI